MATNRSSKHLRRAGSLSDLEQGRTPFDLTALKSALPHVRPQQTSPLLALPTELRLQIYSFALGYPLSHLQKLAQDGGRTRIRITWPPSSKPDALPTHTLKSLLLSSSQARCDILPSFHRTSILKFPAWNPNFKVHCLKWIENASDEFIRGLSWIWFEGVYWRFSVRLGEGKDGEDEKATREDCHQYEETEWFEGLGGNFVVRVDFVRAMRRQASDAAGEICDLLDELFDREGSLGKRDMGRLLREIRLTVEEQLRGMSHRNYGIRTVYPPR